MRRNKEKRFREFVERCRDTLWHVCVDYGLSDAWEPQDAFQEVLVALWNDFDTLKETKAEKVWAYRVASHTMLRIKRKYSNRPQGETVEVDAEHVTTQDENYNSLLQLIDALDEDDTFVVRAYLDGFSYREIAQMTGRSTGAVAMQLSRAKQKIRDSYENGF